MEIEIIEIGGHAATVSKIDENGDKVYALAIDHNSETKVYEWSKEYPTRKFEKLSGEKSRYQLSEDWEEEYFPGTKPAKAIKKGHFSVKSTRNCYRQKKPVPS